MTSDMVRVGRGGAGNYHSAPVNLTCSRLAQKKDAAALAPSKSQLARATQPAQAPVLTGRGGAGNAISEPNATAHAEGQRLEDLEAGGGPQVTGTDVAARNPHGVLSGRGGAGNWRDRTAERQGEDAVRIAEARNKAAAHVDGELRRPEPTHTRTRHCERRLER
ncbi:hypothetical protein A9K55_000563 [Cordyceps militaris]|uniref:Uncharacterized protein n=1 Tax=Cordyceps militaris TaxID=73501 RepID=A0A2H4SUV4_CORMI|nr:hypothetical protein A9K55_000563 [Cordyceps militaris]